VGKVVELIADTILKENLVKEMNCYNLPMAMSLLVNLSMEAMPSLQLTITEVQVAQNITLVKV
jgi:hypothetical protein